MEPHGASPLINFPSSLTSQRHRTSQLSDEHLARGGVIHEEQCENDVEVSGSKQGWRVLRYGENGPEYLEKRLSGDSGRVLLELTAKFKRKGMSTNIKGIFSSRISSTTKLR